MPRYSPPQPNSQLGALPLPVVRPIPARALVAGVSAIVMATALFAYFVEVASREYVKGWLVPVGGEIRIVAPYTGTLVDIAAPGTRLAEGEPVAVLRDSRAADGSSVASVQANTLTLNEKSLTAEINALSSEQRNREANLLRQIELASSQVTQAQREGAVRREALELGKADLARNAKLVTAGFQSANKLEQLEGALRLQEADMLAAVRSEATAKAQLASFEAELSQSRSRGDIARLEKERQRADLHAQQSVTGSAMRAELAAPMAVVVLNNAATRGSTVQEGQLVSILAQQAARMEAQVLIPARAAAKVSVGQPIQLRLTAYPYEVFGAVDGEITQIDDAPLLPEESDKLRQAAGADAFVRATVKIILVPLDAKGLPLQLKSGMPLEASVEIERRTLLSWVMWPLLKHFK
jgi:membrane fusion protein